MEWGALPFIRRHTNAKGLDKKTSHVRNTQDETILTFHWLHWFLDWLNMGVEFHRVHGLDIELYY